MQSSLALKLLSNSRSCSENSLAGFTKLVRAGMAPYCSLAFRKFVI